MTKTIFTETKAIEAINLGDMIIHTAKQALKYGSGNQKINKRNKKLEVYPGVYTRTPAAYLTEESRALAEKLEEKTNKEFDPNHMPQRAIAIAAKEVGGGNCQELSALVYVLCREYFTEEWSISVVDSEATYKYDSAYKIDKHAFVVLWKGGESYDPEGKEKVKRKVEEAIEEIDFVLAIDAWPINAQTVFLDDHWADSVTDEQTNKKCKGSTPPNMEEIKKMAAMLRNLRIGEEIDMTIPPPLQSKLMERSRNKFEEAYNTSQELKKIREEKIKEILGKKANSEDPDLPERIFCASDNCLIDYLPDSSLTEQNTGPTSQ
ncbi:TPA: hypothetical protein ACG0T7_000379 [Pseudomonas aeruginosa]|uniref:hypothetical protein n=1 Tax=Pseudomonas aeruginosa TaxID=287 RepID=UPI000FFC57D9|nr:hypothetical protein [Pseudomonas aeruginosa]UTQ41252.1 hypothetical protein MMZ70_11150 [Pseudomonas aeruginosa]HEJ2814348.1 hypothetical protein [Pseudomonas aeruginosa]